MPACEDTVELFAADLFAPGSYDAAFADCAPSDPHRSTLGLQSRDAPRDVRRLLHPDPGRSDRLHTQGRDRQALRVQQSPSPRSPIPAKTATWSRKMTGPTSTTSTRSAVRGPATTSRGTVSYLLDKMANVRYRAAALQDGRSSLHLQGVVGMVSANVIGPVMSANYDLKQCFQSLDQGNDEVATRTARRRKVGCDGPTATCRTLRAPTAGVSRAPWLARTVRATSSVPSYSSASCSPGSIAEATEGAGPWHCRSGGRSDGRWEARQVDAV